MSQSVFAQLLEFVGANAGWLAVGSIVSLLVGILSLPFLVTRIPEDYFLHQKRVHKQRSVLGFIGRMLFAVIKNALGAVFIVAGLLMLVLPGQGLLTLFAGLLVMNYPGKFALERWLVTRPRVLPTINRLREKHGHRPLIHPDGAGRSP